MSDSGNIITDTFTNGINDSEVVLCSIVYGGHYWPGSDDDPYKEVSATELIWEFFKNHPKQ